jgi:hypothetical protein
MVTESWGADYLKIGILSIGNVDASLAEREAALSQGCFWWRWVRFLARVKFRRNRVWKTLSFDFSQRRVEADGLFSPRYVS